MTKTLTEIFRDALATSGAGTLGLEAYVWDGEPLYNGNPIAGGLTGAERKAVDAVYVAIKSGEHS